MEAYGEGEGYGIYEEPKGISTKYKIKGQKRKRKRKRKINKANPNITFEMDMYPDLFFQFKETCSRLNVSQKDQMTCFVEDFIKAYK